MSHLLLLCLKFTSSLRWTVYLTQHDEMAVAAFIIPRKFNEGVSIFGGEVYRKLFENVSARMRK